MSVIGLSGCTLMYGGIDVIKRYDICTQAQLTDFPVGLPNATDKARVLLDGSVLAVESNLIRHLHANGSSEAFTDANSCLSAADANETTLYTVDVCNSRILSWNLAPGDLIGVVKQYTTGEIADRGNAYPIGVRVYDRGAPPKPVIFVHGIQQKAPAPHFQSVLADPDIAGSVLPFIYYQDAGTNACDEPLLDPVDAPYPETVMPSFASGGPGEFCDSESDFGSNVALLYATVQSAYEASGGQTTILMGYSMGGALIRGLLSYSMQLPDDLVARSEMDSVVLVAGAMDGSSGAKCKLSNKCPFGFPNWAISVVQHWMNREDHINTSRPAIQELLPQSQWYEWANAVDLPQIGYYEAHAEMHVVSKQDRVGRSSRLSVIWDSGDGILTTFWP